MRTLVIALLAAGAQEDVEAKKKRLGELVRQMGEIQAEAEKLLNELSGGDRAKQDAIMGEVLRKHAPKLAEQVEGAARASNERGAAASLKTLASAQADFRANDRDEDGFQDFWVGDVSGLYRIHPGGGAVKLIELSLALADAKPCVPPDKAGKYGSTPLAALDLPPAPKAGYRFAVVPKFQLEEGAVEAYHGGDGKCVSRFAFCAFPADYPASGRLTFLIREDNTVWKKDTGGKAVDVAPAEPREAGWTRLD